MIQWIAPVVLVLVNSVLGAIAGQPSAQRLESQTQTPQQLVAMVVAAAGGEAKLLKLFRFRERVIIDAVPPPPVAADEKGNRTSVVEVSGDWWVGSVKRDKDKVRILAWAWSLRILLDPKSQVEAIKDAKINGSPAFGLRVSMVIKEPLDLYFARKDSRLVAIDYTDTRHVFSEWKKTAGGQGYPSRVVGFRFTDRAKGVLNEQQWYQTDILELTPLKKLPPDLKR